MVLTVMAEMRSSGKVRATAERGGQVDHAGRRGPGVILEFSGLEAAAAAAAIAESAAGQEQDDDDDEKDREHDHPPRPN